MKFFTFFTLLLSYIPTFLLASDYRKLEKSEAALLFKHEELLSGQRNYVGLHIKLDPEWHVYWKNPGDSGAAPIFSLETETPGIHLEETLYPIPERIFYDPLVTFGYEKEVLYILPLKVDPDLDQKKVTIKLHVEYLVCKIDCIPVVTSFERTVPLINSENKPSRNKEAPLFESYKEKLPLTQKIKAKHQSVEDFFLIKAPFKMVSNSLQFFPLAYSHIKNHPIDIKQNPTSLEISLKKSQDQSSSLEGLLVYETDEGVKSQWIESSFAESETAWSTLLYFMLLAFVGGLILNLMPCVFPVLGIKMLGILHHSSRAMKEVRLRSLSTVAGMLLSFLVFGFIIVFFKWSGEALGWGFQLQSPWFVGFLVLLFFALALNLLDLLKIPFFVIHKAPRGSGYVTEFLHGVLAVVVASPCTAPFMGAAMGYAITQPTHSILAIFLGLGIGFAFPFIVFSIVPQAAKYLPKPGTWLSTLKRWMALPLFLTTIWLGFVWVQLYRTQDTLSSGTSEIWAEYKLGDWETLLKNPEPLFLNFTASWCITCQVNELTTFQTEKVQKFVKEKKIRMVRVDWTKREEEIANIIQSFGRISVPLYVYIPSPEGEAILLPEILSPDILIEEIKKQNEI